MFFKTKRMYGITSLKALSVFIIRNIQNIVLCCFVHFFSPFRSPPINDMLHLKIQKCAVSSTLEILTNPLDISGSFQGSSTKINTSSKNRHTLALCRILLALYLITSRDILYLSPQKPFRTSNERIKLPDNVRG